MVPVAQFAAIDRLDHDPLGLVGRGRAHFRDPGGCGIHSQDADAAVVGHPYREIAAAVLAVIPASGGLLVGQPVVAFEQGGWACWVRLLMLLWILVVSGLARRGLMLSLALPVQGSEPGSLPRRLVHRRWACAKLG